MNQTNTTIEVEGDTLVPAFPCEEQTILQQIRKAITQADPMVDERPGPYLQHDNAFIYEQEGLFKYCLARTKHYYTFRSVPMYSHPEIRKDILSVTSFFKVKKGCLNFTDLSSFPVDLFRQWLSRSANTPYMTPGLPIHYLE